MWRTGDIPRPLIRSGLASVLVHLAALAAPVGGGPPAAPRVFMPQPPLPVIEARFRAAPVHVQLSLPADRGEPSAEPPPPQVIIDAHPAAPGAVESPGASSPIPARYFRPSEISDPPYPLTVAPIDIDDAGVGPNGIVFSVEILIDEAGRVDSIALDSGAVPASVWSKVEREFGKTTYRPGRLMDKPVKSRLRIELSIPPAAKP
jgi:hypothetical protein